MEERPKSAEPEDELSVWDAIQTYETILEVFPEDVNALESLVVFYEQVKDLAKLREKARVLIKLLASEGDWGQVKTLAERLLKMDPTDAEAATYRSEAMQKLVDDGTPPPPAPGLKTDIRHTELTFDLRGELDLAWVLLQNSVITQDQYENAIERLTESSMNAQGETPLALLQELREMERIDMDKIIAFLAAQSGLPYLEMGQCECREESVALLPLGRAKRLGVLPFDQIENELMVAILNPVDLQLRQRLTRCFGMKVHFFFTSPDEFQGAIAKYLERVKKGAPAKP